MKWPADRLASQAGKSFGMYEVAAGLESCGADVIHLEVGRPSFDTPLTARSRLPVLINSVNPQRHLKACHRSRVR